LVQRQPSVQREAVVQAPAAGPGSRRREHAGSKVEGLVRVPRRRQRFVEPVVQRDWEQGTACVFARGGEQAGLGGWGQSHTSCRTVMQGQTDDSGVIKSATPSRCSGAAEDRQEFKLQVTPAPPPTRMPMHLSCNKRELLPRVGVDNLEQCVARPPMPSPLAFIIMCAAGFG